MYSENIGRVLSVKKFCERTQRGPNRYIQSLREPLRIFIFTSGNF